MMQNQLTQAETYAQALFAEAEKADRLDAVRQSLVNVRAVAESGAGGSLKSVLEAPGCIVLPETKKKFVQDVLKEAGAEDDLVSKTFSLMIDKEAADSVPTMIDRFEGLWRDAKGIVIAKVTTAAPLEKCNFDFNLDETLQSLAGADKTVWTATTVDPGIRGGAIIDIDDKLYDFSVDTKMKNFMQYILDSCKTEKFDEAYKEAMLKRFDDRAREALSKFVKEDEELQFPNVEDEVEKVLAQTEEMDGDAKRNWLRKELAEIEYNGKPLISMEDSAWVGLTEKERKERARKDVEELKKNYVPPEGKSEISAELKALLEKWDEMSPEQIERMKAR
jgi:ATP synthase F1 delta subunit